MNRITSFIFSFLVMSALFLAPATVSASDGSTAGPGDGMTVTLRGDTMTITCPDQVKYQIQPTPDWTAGMEGFKELRFSDVSVKERFLFCTYEVNNTITRDTTTLTRPMPAGYVCDIYFGGEKARRQFNCKRAVAPIKIKPKSP